MSRLFTKEQIAFIRTNYPENGAAWVAAKLGMKASQIKTFASNTKLLRTNFYHVWTAEQLELLLREYPNRRTESIAEELGIAYHLVTNKAHRLKLRETPEFYKSQECGRFDGSVGKNTRFIKGQVPPNKGKTMSPEIREKVKHTWFQSGHEPHNTKYDGYERITKDGYREIRVQKGKFELLHRYNWEKVNGPIPEDLIMRCKDGDIRNCDPDNWFLIDRASQLDQNSGRDTLEDRYIIAKLTHRHPELKPALAEMPEFIELKRSQIKLKRTINELTETPTNG